MKWVPFAEATRDVTRGHVKIPKSEYRRSGPLAVVDQGRQLVAGYTHNHSAAVSINKPLILFGDHTRTWKYLDFPFAVGADGVKLFAAQKGFATRYLYWYFTSQSIPDAGYSRHFKFVRNLTVPKMPIDEQRRIAAILDQADAIRTKRRQQLEHLDSLPQAIFHEMFGSLSRDTPVSAVGRVQLGRQRSPKYQSGKHTRPYVRVANVQLNALDLNDVLSMDFDDQDFASYSLEYGDILLNEGQSTELVGRPAMWRNEIPGCCFQNTLLRFQADQSKVLPEFALHSFIEMMLDGTFAKTSSKTSNVAHLGKSRLERLKIAVPPLSQQREFEKIASGISREASRLREAAASDDALFSSLQSRAFRGEL